MDVVEGTEVGGWCVGKRIGGGADGEVYEASKESHQAALKVFNIKSFGGGCREAAMDRLAIQLSLCGAKQHKNLVEIYEGDFCHEIESPFLVMELVKGRSLDRITTPLPPDVICGIAAQLSEAAEFLEKRELVHRDIKPANVMLSEDNSLITLLDLSILHGPGDAGVDDRLSGEEFVATLRYSPPEFVWRKEEGELNDAWRAVSFYQIGATMHDLIMQKKLFEGMDTPRSHLYDAVKYATPDIQSEHLPPWLIGTLRASLLKDWRQRLDFLSWDSFREPLESLEHFDREQKLKLRQAHVQETHAATTHSSSANKRATGDEELWALNRNLFSESRNYFIDSDLYPRFKTEEFRINNSYTTKFTFEVDELKGFCSGLAIEVQLSHDPQPGFHNLGVTASADGKILTNASWVEFFSVDSAFSRVKQATLDALDALLPT
jgi:serine/threonine protein kinase